ncbi:MAG: hypothetical protein KatS3mg033_0853 [Thermonema sp.]|nr:MAG: hypothetical protein KatS3mg033_0853 [Thermonema sp.]
MVPMKHPFFRTLKYGILLGCGVYTLFWILLVLIYDNPIDSTPKAMDVLLFIGISVGTTVYYKLRVAGGQLSFSEGLVMLTLTYSSLVIMQGLLLYVTLELSPGLLDTVKQMRLATLEAEKEEWISRLEKPSDFAKLKKQVQLLTTGIILWQETGFRLLVGFVVSLVGATGLRS